MTPEQLEKQTADHAEFAAFAGQLIAEHDEDKQLERFAAESQPGQAALLVDPTGALLHMIATSDPSRQVL